MAVAMFKIMVVKIINEPNKMLQLKNNVNHLKMEVSSWNPKVL